MYWVFDDRMLQAALAAWEARRQREEGASEQQTKDDSTAIARFLASPEADRHKLIGGRK